MGYTANVAAHKGDTNAESTMIDTAITNKSVAIILDPANADGSVGAVKKAVDAGIPVFLVNAEINQEGLAKAQLVSNNAQGAAMGATQWQVAMGDKGTYVELFGNPADNNAATRSNGYETVLSQYPDLKKVGKEVADWDRTKGHNKMQSLLQANPDINGVIAGNDEMALGAIAALKEAGKLANVKVGGFDGSPDAVAAVKAGEMQYTVLQPVAVFSAEAVKQADSFIKTGKTGRRIGKAALRLPPDHQGQCRQVHRSLRSLAVMPTEERALPRAPDLSSRASDTRASISRHSRRQETTLAFPSRKRRAMSESPASFEDSDRTPRRRSRPQRQPSRPADGAAQADRRDGDGRRHDAHRGSDRAFRHQPHDRPSRSRRTGQPRAAAQDARHRLGGSDQPHRSKRRLPVAAPVCRKARDRGSRSAVHRARTGDLRRRFHDGSADWCRISRHERRSPSSPIPSP